MEEQTEHSANQAEVETVTPPATLGAMLREGRVRLGMSISDVANQIKFAPRQIEALEADDFKAMPEAAFLRGFVRSYGKLLHLDCDVLFAALPAAKVATLSSAPASNEISFSNIQTARQQNYIWLGAALVFVVIALGFAIANLNSPTRQVPVAPVETAVPLPTDMTVLAELPIEAASAVEPIVPIVPIVVAGPAKQVAVAAPVPAKQADVRPNMPPPIKMAKAEAKANNSAQASTTAVSVQSITAVTSTAKATIPIDTLLGTQPVKDQGVADESISGSGLRIVFGEESWAEIKDKNGKSLSSQINPGGSELHLEGKAPFTLSVSHAKSVRLYYKGKLIDLTPHINKYSKSEVARITLE